MLCVDRESKISTKNAEKNTTKTLFVMKHTNENHQHHSLLATQNSYRII